MKLLTAPAIRMHKKAVKRRQVEPCQRGTGRTIWGRERRDSGISLLRLRESTGRLRDACPVRPRYPPSRLSGPRRTVLLQTTPPRPGTVGAAWAPPRVETKCMVNHSLQQELKVSADTTGPGESRRGGGGCPRLSLPSMALCGGRQSEMDGKRTPCTPQS